MQAFIAIYLGAIVLAPVAYAAAPASGLPQGQRQHFEQSNATASGSGAHSAGNNNGSTPLPPAGAKPGKTATDGWINTGGSGGGNKEAGNGGTYKDGWINTGGGGGGASHKGGTTQDDWENTSGTVGKRQH